MQIAPQSMIGDSLTVSPDIGPPRANSDTVAVIGLGYVGLPMVLALEQAGRLVIGIDASESRLRAIQSGEVDLAAADLSRLELARSRPGLVLTSNAARLSFAGTVIICVPTPLDAHLTPEMTALHGACATAVRHATRGQTIVLTSTSYVGTTRDLLIDPLNAAGHTVGRDIFVAFSPERIDPANERYPQNAVPRVVGGATPACTERAARALRTTSPVIHTVSSPETAEMTKLYENAFRAVNIAFANEMADATHAIDVSIHEVLDAAATKPYGFMKFTPGPGVGGQCIPTDPHYLLWQLRARHTETPLLEQAMSSIAARPGRIVTRINETLSERRRSLRDARILVIGVAYKPGVEDVRESPAAEIIGELRSRGALVEYHDPKVATFRDSTGAALRSVASPVAETYDLVLVHTIHPGFDPASLRNAPIVLDATYSLAGLPDRILP